MGNQTFSPYQARNNYFFSSPTYKTQTLGQKNVGNNFNAFQNDFFISKISGFYDQPNNSQEWHLTKIILTLVSIDRSQPNKIIEIGAPSSAKMTTAGQITLNQDQNHITKIKIGFDKGGLTSIEIFDNDGTSQMVGYQSSQGKQSYKVFQIDGYLLGMSGTSSRSGVQSIDFKFKPMPFIKTQVRRKQIK